MIIASYDQPAREQLLASVDDRYPVFFQKEYSAFINAQKSSRLVLFFSDGGCVCIPIRLIKTRFFKMAQLLYPPVTAGERLGESKEADILNLVVEHIGQARLCHRIIQSPTHCVFHAVPRGSTACRFGSYVLDLQSRSEDDLFAGMNPDHRREIRRARDQGIRVEFGPVQLENCLRVCLETMQRSEMTYMNREDFVSLYRHLAQSERVLCGVAYQQGQPLAGLLVPFTKAGAFYVIGGSATEMTVPGANKLLHWETIRNLRRRGVAKYDFVGARLSDVRGSKLEHIQRFKARFGGILEQGFLWKTDIRKVSARLFDLLFAMRQRLRGQPKRIPSDVIDQERFKEVIQASGSNNAMWGDKQARSTCIGTVKVQKVEL